MVLKFSFMNEILPCFILPIVDRFVNLNIGLYRYSFESLSSLPLKPLYFTERYMDVKEVLVNTFFGPSTEGVYSPSVQATPYEMAKTVLARSFSQFQLIIRFPFSLPTHKRN